MARHPTYHVNVIKIKMRDYMDRRVTTPKRVTSPTWGLHLYVKKALKKNTVATEQKLLGCVDNTAVTKLSIS